MTEVILIQGRTGILDKIQTCPSLPLALLNISTLIDKNYKIKSIDQRIDKNWERNLRRELNQNPICVGTTSMSGRQIKHALEISKVVKESSPETPVVWGGVHPSLLPEQTLENENVDVVVKGEGEVTFYELVKALGRGKSLKGIEGVWYKEDGTIKSNFDRPFLDLNELPELPYHLIDVRRYLPKYSERKTIYIETSRGCPHECAFCYNNVLHKRCWRALTAEKSFERIKKMVDNFKIENFWLVDDNFFVDLKRSGGITKKLIKERYDLTWDVTGLRVDAAIKMNDQDFRLLEKSNCQNISFGIETGSERILKLIKKDISVEQVIRINKKLTKFNLIPSYNFMAGFPTETNAELKETIKLMFRLMKENKKALISPMKIFTPFPGTKLFKEAVKEGFEPPSRLEDWSNFNWSNLNLPWVSKKRKIELERLYFTSVFLSNKLEQETKSNWIKWFSKIYRMVAENRIRHLYFDYMPEMWIKDRIENYLN